MSTIERICPSCGKSNPADRTHCIRCGKNLVPLAPSKTNLPAPFDSAKTGLVLGASLMIARIGLNLLAREILPRVAQGLMRKTTSAIAERAPVNDEPEYVVRGWRTWSVRHGNQRTSGSEKFEWRVRKK